MPAASGYDGTLMGFGTWDHAALKGHFLVLREWKDGRSVQVDRNTANLTATSRRQSGSKVPP